MAAVLVPAAVVLAAVAFVSVSHPLEVRLMTQDVTKIGGMHPLTGFLSSLGILLWCAAASVCLFAAAMVAHGRRREAYRFLLSSGLLSGYLALDDLFVVHDALAPRYLGVPEVVVYAALALFVAAHLVAFRRTILRTDSALLAISMGLLGSSVAIDTILEPRLPRHEDLFYLAEDGTKWLGIAAWFAYHGRAALQLAAADRFAHVTARVVTAVDVRSESGVKPGHTR